MDNNFRLNGENPLMTPNLKPADNFSTQKMKATPGILNYFFVIHCLNILTQ